MTLRLHPLTLKEARNFVGQYHRHHKPPQGGLFAIGVAKENDDYPSGVVIVGRPVARMLDDGWTAEVTRLCTNGEKNACSILYSAAWRACRAMGYRMLITYILQSESGQSLRAANWRCIGKTDGGSWSCNSRPRFDKHPLEGKLLWEAASD